MPIRSTRSIAGQFDKPYIFLERHLNRIEEPGRLTFTYPHRDCQLVHRLEKVRSTCESRRAEREARLESWSDETESAQRDLPRAARLRKQATCRLYLSRFLRRLAEKVRTKLAGQSPGQLPALVQNAKQLACSELIRLVERNLEMGVADLFSGEDRLDLSALYRRASPEASAAEQRLDLVPVKREPENAIEPPARKRPKLVQSAVLHPAAQRHRIEYISMKWMSKEAAEPIAKENLVLTAAVKEERQEG